MNPQSALICKICKSTLKKPVFLPCMCTICDEHVKDLFTQSNKNHIECQLCFKVSQVPESGLESNILASSLISKYGDKFTHEKKFLTSLDKSMKALEIMRIRHTKKYAELELAIFEHFAALKRDIDLRREQLKLNINEMDSRCLKIDDTANQLIGRVKQRENDFKVKLLQNKMDQSQIESVSVEQPFRNPKLIGKSVEHLLNELNEKIADLNGSFAVFTAIEGDLYECTFSINYFRVVNDFNAEFGYLKLEKDVKEKENWNNWRYGDDYDEDNDYKNDYNDDDSNDSIGNRDYTACDKDDCGYCGHCNY